MFNILTIDLEDYFQVHAFSDVIKFEDWGNHECRIERNTDRILSILDDSVARPHFSHLSTKNSELYGTLRTPHSALRIPVKATFFVLGWLAERYPDLVRRIQKEGHEIACHGYAHRLVYAQSRDEFRQDVKRAKSILEDITGDEVMGYRAPSYSITNKSRWAFKILVEEGFQYDSSIFPIHHDFYGMPDAPRYPFAISSDGNSNAKFSMLNFEKLLHGSTAAPFVGIPPNSELCAPRGLLEFPVSTVKWLRQNVPISGGGYFRLFPYSLIRKGLKNINQKENMPFIFYVHPWEFDSGQPKIKSLSFRSKFRHYINLDKTECKFKKLLSDFQFSSIRELLRKNGSTA